AEDGIRDKLVTGVQTCALPISSASDDGFELSGLILQAHEDVPYVVRYVIRVDQSWRTREVEVEVENGGSRSLRLSADAGGHWSEIGRASCRERVVRCVLAVALA